MSKYRGKEYRMAFEGDDVGSSSLLGVKLHFGDSYLEKLADLDHGEILVVYDIDEGVLYRNQKATGNLFQGAIDQLKSGLETLDVDIPFSYHEETLCSRNIQIRQELKKREDLEQMLSR